MTANHANNQGSAATPVVTPDHEALREHLGDLRVLVEAESPSDDIAALVGCADAVARVGQRYLGRAPTRLTASDGRVHLAWYGPGPGPHIGLLGHLDTVCPVGTLDSNPWQVDATVVSGPGVFDMKAGIVQAFRAVAGLDEDQRLRVDILVTADEEIGAPTSAELIVQFARSVAAVLVVEPAAGRAVKTGRKGSAVYEIEIHGVAAHAGLEPELGVNAAVAAARLVIALGGLTDIGRGTTVTPTRIVGGDKVNVVPAHAIVHADVRTTTTAEARRIDDAITELAAQGAGSGPGAAATMVVRSTASCPPLETAMSAALFERARAVAAGLGLPDLEGASVGGASDGNLTAADGTLTLDGLGAVGGGAHSPNEHVTIADIPERVALLQGLISDLLRHPVTGATDGPA